MRQHIVETFNTHRMDAELVRKLATGREELLRRIMRMVRSAWENPEATPQHILLKGVRGSGKSFLMRLVELEIDALAKEGTGPGIAAALLPEEHFNIKYPHDILDNAAKVLLDEDWSAAAYRFLSKESQAEAWDASLAALHQALDKRFAAHKGRGLAVIMLENFDALADSLFGRSGRKSQQNREQAAAEERFRKLLAEAGGRCLFLCGAARAVDMDDTRPLFLAFMPEELKPWSAEECIDYFNKRRALDHLPPLSPEECARAEAVARFIGGNPRLAQLLGDAVTAPDAYSIAQILDMLSDRLAEYYRTRLEDLPPAASGVLDALIRHGEPRSQSGIAELMDARQNQIADAFSYLRDAGLLEHETEIGGNAKLYRVRDRLFVHFYRRRYGGQAEGLAPIAGLLESFFTAREREKLARELLEKGSFADADLYMRTLVSGTEPRGYCGYRDAVCYAAAVEYGDLVRSGLPEETLEERRKELVEKPKAAVAFWARRAAEEIGSVERVAACSLHALALSRSGLDAEALEVLQNAHSQAGNDGDAEARIFALAGLYVFLAHRKEESVPEFMDAWLSLLPELLKRADSAQARQAGHWLYADLLRAQRRYPEALEQAKVALEAALERGRPSAPLGLYMLIALCSLVLGKYDDADAACAKAFTFSKKARRKDLEADLFYYWCGVKYAKKEKKAALALCRKARKLCEDIRDEKRLCGTLFEEWRLHMPDKAAKALPFAEKLIECAKVAENISWQAMGLLAKGETLKELGHEKEALALFARAEDMLRDTPFHDARVSVIHAGIGGLKDMGNIDLALEKARAALALSRGWGRPDLERALFHIFLSVAADSAAPDLVEQLDAFVERHGADGKMLARDSGFSLVRAVDRASLWPEFTQWLRTRRPFGQASARMAFFFLGVAWAEKEKRMGRGRAYEAIDRDLPFVTEMMKSMPVDEENKLDAVMTGSAESRSADRIPENVIALRVGINTGHLTMGLLSRSDAPDFLNDLAALFDRRFGPDFGWNAAAMRAFAAYHAAPDKAKYLQRADPDMASVIKLIWEKYEKKTPAP